MANRFIFLFSWILLLSLSVSRAEARDGFFFGVAFGPGFLKTSDAPTDHFRVSLPNIKVGTMLTPNLALLAHIPTGVHRRDGKFRAFESIMPALQWWPIERLWILGGAGLVMDFPLIGTATTGFYTGFPNVAVAVGYELCQIGQVAVDLQARVLHGKSKLSDTAQRTSTAYDLLVGFTWF